MTLPDLIARWSRAADDLERFGAVAQAQAVRTCVEELRAALADQDAELLTLAQASAASGYSKRRLRELVVEKKLENHGEHGAPRFRRGELPMKSGGKGNVDTSFDADAEVRRLLEAS